MAREMKKVAVKATEKINNEWLQLSMNPSFKFITDLNNY
jgi:hypothetical protein